MAFAVVMTLFLSCGLPPLSQGMAFADVDSSTNLYLKDFPAQTPAQQAEQYLDLYSDTDDEMKEEEDTQDPTDHEYPDTASSLYSDDITTGEYIKERLSHKVVPHTPVPLMNFPQHHQIVITRKWYSYLIDAVVTVLISVAVVYGAIVIALMCLVAYTLRLGAQLSQPGKSITFTAHQEGSNEKPLTFTLLHGGDVQDKDTDKDMDKDKDKDKDTPDPDSVTRGRANAFDGIDPGDFYKV